jgi:hypothetical protein
MAFSTINARVEAVDNQPAFREAFQRRHCLGRWTTFMNTSHIPSIGFPRYAGLPSDFWSDHPQANRLGSLLTIGHISSDALGLC